MILNTAITGAHYDALVNTINVVLNVKSPSPNAFANGYENVDEEMKPSTKRSLDDMSQSLRTPTLSSMQVSLSEHTPTSTSSAEIDEGGSTMGRLRFKTAPDSGAQVATQSSGASPVSCNGDQSWRVSMEGLNPMMGLSDVVFAGEPAWRYRHFARVHGWHDPS